MNKKKEETQRILMKDNLLVRTKYELTLAENRLYNLILYKFQKQGQLLKCTLTHEEAKEIIKHKGSNSLEAIGIILDNLSNKKIWIEEKKKGGKYSKWHKYNLLNGFTFDNELNTFEIYATAFIYELLIKKFDNGGYTPTNLNTFLTLGNYYAQRLYELLRLWSNTKTIINYPVEELKTYLMLEEKYPQYGDFKKRVITPAVKELNKSGVFEIDIKEHKTGRKVTSIDFIVKDLDKRKYFTDVKEAPTPEIVEVDTLLNDGEGNLIPVKQGCFKLEGMTPAEGQQVDTEPTEPTEELTEVELLRKELLESFNNTSLEDKIKFVKLPQDNILNKKMEEEFIKYCYGETISFNDKDILNILKETEEIFKDKKKVKEVTTKVNYKFFEGIFKNKCEDYYNSVTVDNLYYTQETPAEENIKVFNPSFTLK